MIFAAVAIVAGGGGFYFFKIYQPAQVKKAAREEINRWEERWDAARACLLGPTPGSTKTSEALAIREMNPDPWNRGSCTPLISKLSRGDEPDTGLNDVEAAWVDLDKAATKAAGAFATHIVSSTVLKDDPLPDALDALDAARAALRASVGMPALAQTGTKLAEAKIIRVDDGKTPLEELTVETKPSAHGMIVFGRSHDADRDVQVALRTGASPVVAPVSGDLRAVPDPTWGARTTADGIDIGTIDDTGKMPTPIGQKLAGPAIAAIIGTKADGRVIFGNDKQLLVGHVAVGKLEGTLDTTLDPSLPSVGSRAVIDVDGRAAVIWRDDKQAHGRIFKAGADEPAVDLGDNALGSICLAGDRAWVSTGTGILAFGGGKPMVMRANPFFAMLGCTPDAALLRSVDPRKPFLICTDDCRTVNLPSGAPEQSAATVVGGKLIAIASHNGVLGVWREGTAPQFFGLPEHADPVMAQEWPAMAMTDGKLVDILARGAKGFVVIRIPAN
jgi:hypothetical protein